MDKVKYIKMQHDDGSFSENIPISPDIENIKTKDTIKDSVINIPAQEEEISFSLCGNSYQEKTKGLQLVDFNKPKYFAGNYSFINNQLYIKTYNQSFAYAHFDIQNIFQDRNNLNKILYFNYKSIKKINTRGEIIQLSIQKNNGFWERINLLDDGFIITEKFMNCQQAIFCLYTNNTSENNLGDSILTMSEPILSFEKNIEYEDYSELQESPNPNYPQNIRNVKDINYLHISGKNLFDGIFRQGNAWGEENWKNARLFSLNSVLLKAGETYTISSDIDITKFDYAINLFYWKAPVTNSWDYLFDSGWQSTKNYSLTPTQDCYCNVIVSKKDKNNNITLDEIQNYHWQIEKGNTATEYEEYNGLNQIVSLNSNLFFHKNQIGSVTSTTTYVVDKNGNIIQRKSDYSAITSGKRRNFTLEAGTYKISIIGKKENATLQVHNITRNQTIISILENERIFTLTETSELGLKTYSPEGNNYFANYKIKIEKWPNNKPEIELNSINEIRDKIYFNNTTKKWVLEKNIKEQTLDGTESWGAASNNGKPVFIISLALKGPGADTILCDKLQYKGNTQYDKIGFSISGNPREEYPWAVCIQTPDDVVDKDDVKGFKQWLSKNPLKIYYVLKNPEITEITDTELIEQLNNIKAELNKKKEINIIQENTDMPFIIEINATTNAKEKIESIEKRINDNNTEIENVKKEALKEEERTDNKISKIKQDLVLLQEDKGHIFGVRRKITNNSNPQWERILDSTDLTAAAKKGNNDVYNNFDYLAPWCRIKTCNYDIAKNKVNAWIDEPTFKFDGTNGDVFTYIPATYWKIYQEDDYDYILLADFPCTGFTKVNPFYISRYLISKEDTKVRSISNKFALVNCSLPQFRTLVKGLGNNYSVLDWRYYIIQLLYLVEYAHFHSQDILGTGISIGVYKNILVTQNNTNSVIVADRSNLEIGYQIIIDNIKDSSNSSKKRTITNIEEFNEGGVQKFKITFSGDPINVTTSDWITRYTLPNGQCDELKMQSGCLKNDNYHGVIYRGIENPFGNLWQIIDGIIINDNNLYINTKWKTYGDNIDNNYMKLNYTTSTQNRWITETGFDDNFPFLRLPIDSSLPQTHNLYYCDYITSGSSGVNRLIIGGTYSNGGANGFWASHTKILISYSSLRNSTRMIINTQEESYEQNK